MKKATLATATKKLPKGEDRAMTVADKVKITAMMMSGAPCEDIAKALDLPADWVEQAGQLFIRDREFREAASKLTIDAKGRIAGEATIGAISDGQGSDRRG